MRKHIYVHTFHYVVSRNLYKNSETKLNRTCNLTQWRILLFVLFFFRYFGASKYIVSSLELFRLGSIFTIVYNTFRTRINDMHLVTLILESRISLLAMNSNWNIYIYKWRSWHSLLSINTCIAYKRPYFEFAIRNWP